MPSNYLVLCCPLLLLPSIFPSIRVFSNESAICIKWPAYWSFTFSYQFFSNEYSGLISFRFDWSDFLFLQGTLKSFLQHQSSKASILQCSAFFMVQLSHPYDMKCQNSHISHDYWKNNSLVKPFKRLTLVTWWMCELTSDLGSKN